jgi:pyruvate/2-oxoglutarate dehydrogenase complex dihydrolipoamide dehydrogenase (E3) component
VGLTEARLGTQDLVPSPGRFASERWERHWRWGRKQGYVQVVADEQSDILLGAAMMGRTSRM